MFARRLLLALVLVLGSLPVRAEPVQPDPPGRVGRLSYFEGTVSYHRANEDHWSAAKRNYPVTSGDSFWTEPRSRAEIQVGPVALRMDERSELDVARLDDTVTEFELRQGTLAVTVRAAPPDGVHILTPRGEVVLARKGTYRIDAGEASDSGAADPLQVTVLDGFARVHGPKGMIELHRGESATIDGDPAEYAVGEAAPTAIDDWGQAREKRAVARAGRRYVPEDMTGYEDLDSYGRWESNPTYGPVWYPAAVPAGWAPYRYGHWEFVAPWGWTWIDDAPWGFAPFHYGRWAYIGGVWGWCPGTFVAAPVYAPALVAFVGGSNWGISLSIGAAVGWFPLAPFEVFRPYYPASVTYVKNVNITNVNTTVINNISRGDRHHDIDRYQHHRFATVMGEHDFAHGRNAHDGQVRVPRERLAHASTADRLDHVRPQADVREHTRGPEIRTADGRVPRDGRGDGVRGDARRNPPGTGDTTRMAHADPRGRTPQDQPSNAANGRSSGEQAAPGPRFRSRDGHANETGRSAVPNGRAPVANDGSRPRFEERMSRAPGAPVMRRDDSRNAPSHDAAPRDAASGAARGPDGGQATRSAQPFPWPNGHRGPDNRGTDNGTNPRLSSAAPGPEIRHRAPVDGAQSPGASQPNASQPSAPNVGMPNGSGRVPRSAREEPFTRS
ncbi:MAG: DUF6600 domain-containing protein, partial [Alphaproteobacteria bacterium]